MAFLVQSITLCSKSVSKPWVHLILLESTFPLVDFHVQALLSIIHQMAKHFWTTETIWKRKYFMKKKLIIFWSVYILLEQNSGEQNFAKKKYYFPRSFLVCHFIRKNTLVMPAQTRYLQAEKSSASFFPFHNRFFSLSCFDFFLQTRLRVVFTVLPSSFFKDGFFPLFSFNEFLSMLVSVVSESQLQ